MLHAMRVRWMPAEQGAFLIEKLEALKPTRES
jgi:hypothetical protein